MNRIFEFDNKNEIKLKVEGFDCVPILIGSEQSDGDKALDNLSDFHGCNLKMKSVNVKNPENEIIEVKTYYTVVNARENKYNKSIVENFERKENSNMTVEICLGEKELKRYFHLQYPSTYSLLEVTKRVPGDIFKQLIGSNDSSEQQENIELILYDKDGFENRREVNMSRISDLILSVRVVYTSDIKVVENVSRKAKEAFQMLKDDGKNKIEVISNLKSTVIKMLSLKKA